jgi:hypothetical protein
MLYELGQKYIFNYESNFLTGDYKTDFTSWSSSYVTVTNYLLSLAETIFTGYLIKSNIMSVLNFGKYYTMAHSPFAASSLFFDTGLELPQPSNLRDYRTRGMLPEQIEQVYQTGKQELPNAFKELGINLFFSTVLRDKLLAIMSFIIMSGKLGLEKFGFTDITPITEHKISEEDIVALESLYKELENEFEIKPTEPEPPVGKEQTSIETLSNDITNIIDTNIRYNETKTDIFDAVSETLTEPTEPIIEPTSVYDYEPLTEEEQKIFNELTELKNYFIKLENEDNYIMTPFPDLPSTEPISANTNRLIVPDIEKDIKDAKQSSILDIPDVDDVSIQQNTDRGQDLKPNEIKNKMEL